MTAIPLPKSLQDNPAMGQWLSLDVPGRVIITPGKVELGQGIANALSQIAAEELDLDLALIEARPADTQGSANEGITAGSQSVEVSGAALRLAAAQARAALLQAAGVRLQVGDGLACRNGLILRHGVETGLNIWALSGDVDWQQPVTGDVIPKPVSSYALIGTSAPRPDLPRKALSGGFIHDMTAEAMLHARILRQPFRLARLAEIDAAKLSRRHPGVTVFRKNDFAALLADDEEAVHNAHLAAEFFTRWDEPASPWQPPAAPSETQLGTPADAPAAGADNRVLQARYSRQSIAHASIGPSCALARWQDNRLTVWTHSQGIFPLRAVIARVVGLAPTDLRVIHAEGSGCYGHNGADDAALDAALLAMEFPGRTVRVQWSREDELSRGPVGAPMSTQVEARLDSNDRIADWRLSVSSAPHAQRPGYGGFANLTSAEALDPGAVPTKVEELPQAAGGGASRNARAIYDLPAQDIRLRLDGGSQVRTSSLRALGAHLNVFAIESAMDELAHMAECDALEFRLRHLTDARCRAVLQQAAEMAGWPGTDPKGGGRALGIAAARYKNKGAWLAAVAEVSVDEAIRVEKLWLSVDAGLLINPEGARSQIEGGALQSLSWTLKEGIALQDGRIPPLDWDSYPILRFSELPRIETRFIIDPDQPPLGAGEAAQGPVAAAIGNAASRALGMRMRDLPLTRERLMQTLLEE